VSLIFSSVNVFFRDTEHILSLVMLAWFFVTPVIYPIKEIVGPASPLADWMKCAYFLNPMSGIVVMYRWAFLSNAECLAPCLWMSFAMAGIILLIGVAVFKKCENRFADEL